MARGRTPQPDAVNAAKGRSRKPAKGRQAVPAVTPKLKLAVPPQLGVDAATIWQELGPELTRLNFLRQTDLQPFARYCHHLAKFWQYTADLEIEGETRLVTSAHNPDGLYRVNPKFLMRERIEKTLLALEDRLGLNPAARQQIQQRLFLGVGAPPPGELPLTGGAGTKPAKQAQVTPSKPPAIGGAHVH
jgi:P27 family predicted phage terminase small subunit